METARARGDRLFNLHRRCAIANHHPAHGRHARRHYCDGPLGYPDQLVNASKRLVLVPGRHLTGDGLVLEMHGYLI